MICSVAGYNEFKGHLLRNMEFCPTTVVSEPGCSLGFHVESREFDPGGLRCICLLKDSAPCVGVAAAMPNVNHSGTVAWNLTGWECSRVH